MKTIVKILIFLMISASVLFAQKPDSTKQNLKITNRKQDTAKVLLKKQKAKSKVKKSELRGFVDKNANGIDDRLEKSKKGKQMGRKDQFIDRNGDGICDGRESAIGLRKTHRRGKKHRF